MRVLLVSPHPDDGEVGCGGTISRLRTPQNEIWEIYFCPCTEDPKNKGHLEDHRRAVEVLGIDKLIEKKFWRHSLELLKQEVRDILYKLKEEFKPDLVLCPTPHDFHQDHKAVAECCMTIFRDSSTILGYEILRSVMSDFRPNLYVTLTHLDVEKKLETIKCYKSQIKHRSYYFTPKFIEAQLRVRGAQVKAEWAEAFELLWGRID